MRRHWCHDQDQSRANKQHQSERDSELFHPRVGSLSEHERGSRRQHERAHGHRAVRQPAEGRHVGIELVTERHSHDRDEWYPRPPSGLRESSVELYQDKRAGDAKCRPQGRREVLLFQGLEVSKELLVEEHSYLDDEAQEQEARSKGHGLDSPYESDKEC